MKKPLLLTFFISIYLSVFGQDISPREYIELRYNKDIQLYNGTVHNEYPKTNKGHKYLFTEDNSIGSVIINGTTYDSLQLKYDIYKQNLVLEYVYFPVEKCYINSLNSQGRDYSKASYKIDINPTIVDEFTLGKHRFTAIGETNIAYPYKYLQSIPSTTFNCLIGWRKERLIDVTTMYYTEERRKVYLKIDDRYVLITRKNGIIKRLPKSVRPEVKKHCRKLQFNVKKSDVDKFYSLFTFIDKIMDTNEN